MLGLLAEAPAIPLGEAGKYVAAAYIVFVVLLVVYVAIMAAKVGRIERELRDLAAFAEERNDEERPSADQAAPGRGSEGQSLSDSLAPRGSGGGGAL
jgi:hypothetical protein